jgi:TusE/DsrC/DsvC family sulfur relay protein
MIDATPHALAAKARRPLPLDGAGFVIDPGLWSPGMARAIARFDDLRLTPEHWSILYCMREHHLATGAIPPASLICRSQGLDRNATRRLFGSCRQAWRIAGLPYPGEEALSHMS